MSYAVKIGTTDAVWIDNDPAPSGCVRFDGEITSSMVWGDDVQNLREPNAAELLTAAKIKKVSELKLACKAAIEAGFSSSALGTAHIYDSNLPQDQLNIFRSGTAGVDRMFTCTDADGIKWQRPHTAAQLAQVLSDGDDHVSAKKAHFYTLLAQVNAAIDVETINGIVW